MKVHISEKVDEHDPCRTRTSSFPNGYTNARSKKKWTAYRCVKCTLNALTNGLRRQNLKMLQKMMAAVQT